MTVPPLRTMTAQRRTVDSLGSPYHSPLKANGACEYNSPAPEPAELLGSQRYEVEDQPSRPVYHEAPPSRPVYHKEQPSNRDTSFTALMAHCNIPDQGDEFPVPKVPQVPKPYETRL